jgi:hypothetical protein
VKPLAVAWLKELNVYHRLNDATEAERAAIMRRCHIAVLQVEDKFKALMAAGELKELTARYKAHKAMKIAFGSKPMPWPTFALLEKRKMIRLLAREQLARAKRGLAP